MQKTRRLGNTTAPVVVTAVVLLVRSLAILALAVLAWSRVPVYASDLALWGDAIRLTPQVPRPWVNYGSALADRHDDVGAEIAWRKARDLAQAPWIPCPDRRQVMVGIDEYLGAYYGRTGREPLAAFLFDEALRIRPTIDACP